MNSYLYDNNFSSLLCLCYTLIKSKITPDNIISEDEYIENLFDEPVFFKLDNKKIMKEIRNRINLNILNVLYYAYLSNTQSKELVIYDFIKNTLIYGNSIFGRRNIDSVNEVIKMSHRVGGEAHRMKGFTRFKKMKHFYYSEIEPTNNVIWIIARHFKERLSNEYWIIKDIKREIYAVYNKKKIIFLKKDEVVKLNLDFSKEEMLFEDLWKTFFKTVAIKERENKKCQMNHMPKKYWSNMLEMENEI